MGRSKVPENKKKKLLRVYVSDETVKRNGGYGASQEFAKRCLEQRAEDKKRKA